MKSLFYLYLILLFTGCSLERSIERATSAEEQAEKTQNKLKEKYPELVAEKFAEWFPAKESVKVIHDTVFVPTYVREHAVPSPEPPSNIMRPVPARVYRPKAAGPDLSYYQNTISELRLKAQESAAALEAVKENFRKVQHALYQEQAAHRTTKAQAEKAQKVKTAWFWFSLFLGLVIIWFVIGKIFRFV